MGLLIAVAAIAAIGLLALWRARARSGRGFWVEPPHTPPTVPWAPRGKEDAEPKA